MYFMAMKKHVPKKAGTTRLRSWTQNVSLLLKPMVQITSIF